MAFDSSSFKKQATAATLAQLERWEAHDTDFLAFGNWRGPDIELILDVGANRGQSVVSLLSVFPDASIHCFEANPLYFEVLVEVAKALRGRCTPHPFGLGDKTAQVALYVPWAAGEPFLEESSTVRTYFTQPWVAQKFRERGGLTLKKHLVDIRCGDELALRPQVVKIDVEGAEKRVIAGLAETIKASRPMVMVENSDWHGVTALLSEWGYQPYRYELAQNQCVPFYGEATNCFYFLPEHLAGFGRPQRPANGYDA